MVNYNDPVTIANHFGAYAFPSGFRGWQPDLLVDLQQRGHEALAPHGWCMSVSASFYVPRLQGPVLRSDFF